MTLQRVLPLCRHEQQRPPRKPRRQTQTPPSPAPPPAATIGPAGRRGATPCPPTPKAKATASLPEVGQGSNLGPIGNQDQYQDGDRDRDPARVWRLPRDPPPTALLRGLCLARQSLNRSASAPPLHWGWQRRRSPRRRWGAKWTRRKLPGQPLVHPQAP